MSPGAAPFLDFLFIQKYTNIFNYRYELLLSLFPHRNKQPLFPIETETNGKKGVPIASHKRPHRIDVICI